MKFDGRVGVDTVSAAANTFAPSAYVSDLYILPHLGRNTRKVKPKTGSSFIKEPRVRLSAQPQDSGTRKKHGGKNTTWKAGRNAHPGGDVGVSAFRTWCVLYVSQRVDGCHNI